MSLSQRDLIRLIGVHPLLAAKLAKVSDAMALEGTPIFVVQGVRSQAEQVADYAHGRPGGPPGPIITFVDGITKLGPHQPHPSDGYGYAADLAFVVANITDRSDPRYQRPYSGSWPWDDLGDAIENQGLIWGGRFHGGHMGDLDHAELPSPPV